jgi:penicillin amidase
VTVFRDPWGIPHLRAGSVTELAFEQGRVTAVDRGWQLEIGRLRGEGRTAGVVGEAGIEWDTFARRAALAETAQRAFAMLSEEARSFVAAYVDGVNAAFDGGVTATEFDELDTAPGKWQPWTPLSVFLVQHILFGTFASKLWRHRLAAVAGKDALALFRVEGLPNGSNAFAVGGARTASGLPLVAGDPHRVFEAPNVYAQVRLACPDFDVAGFTFPGVPGVQHFGHAGSVAWAVTNAAADYDGLYVERLERRDDAVWALGPDGWEPTTSHVETIDVRGGASVRVDLVVTDRGPVVVGGADDEEALSLRTTSFVLGDLGFEALLPLLRAQTVGDVDSALAHWVEPVNNVVIADRSGTVLHRVAGRVPERPKAHWDLPAPGWAGHGWTGWVEDLPRTAVAPDCQFVTANQRASADYDWLGGDFAPRFRADRISALLTGRTGVTPDEAGAVLTDTRQTGGQSLIDAVAALADLDAAAVGVRRRLLGWTRRMDADSRGAALFVSLRDAVVERICAAEVLAPLREGSPYGAMYAPWFSLSTRVAGSLHILLAAGSPFGLDLRAIVTAALSDVAAATEDVVWGERHVFHPLHALEQFDLDYLRTAPATGLSGDLNCVLATGSQPGSSMTIRGPVARYVWDLSDRAASRWVVPLGASGHPGSAHHHDQHQAWATGGFVPVVTAWDQLTEERP